MMQDLSQVKKLEEDLRRSERLAALGKMAAGVAHELRNPLSSIKGLALVLQSKFSVENQERETADILVNEVERLNRSISELLDYARPQKLQKDEVFANTGIPLYYFDIGDLQCAYSIGNRITYVPPSGIILPL